MTEVYRYRSEVASNWKLFVDAFVEFYHAPVLHRKQTPKEFGDALFEIGYEALHYELQGPYSMVSSPGGIAPPVDMNMVKPIERVLHSGLFGPWDQPGIKGLTRAESRGPQNLPFCLLGLPLSVVARLPVRLF